MKELIQLYLIFANIGLFTFGGGYAMLPLLQEEIVEKRKWATKEELADYYVIGQCTPGIIGVNVSTFIGKVRKGNLGGIVATLGFITPSIIIITIIATFLTNFADLEIVNNAFAGIRVCVCVLVLNVVRKLYKTSVIDKVTLGIFLVVFLISIFTNLSPIILVISAGIIGALSKKIGGKN